MEELPLRDHSFARWVSRHLRGEMKRLEERVEALGGARLVSHHLRWKKRLEGGIKCGMKALWWESGRIYEKYEKNNL